MKDHKQSQFRDNEQVILWNPCNGWTKYTILTVIHSYKYKDGCYKIEVRDLTNKSALVPTKFLRHYKPSRRHITF